MKKIKNDEWSNKYREASADPLARFLVDRYVPTTKANQLSQAIGDLHTAFCQICLLYTSPSPRDTTASRMPSSA